MYLSAADNSGTGIKQIEFSTSGAQNGGSQVVPDNAASVSISAEGTTLLTYLVVDNAGNREPEKSLTLRLDKAPPTITGLPASGCIIWPPNHKLVHVATTNVADAFSGIVPGSFTVRRD